MDNSNLRKLIIIDQSTSGTKVAIVLENLEILKFEAMEHEQITPHPGWTEHNPNTLINNVNILIEKVISSNIVI